MASLTEPKFIVDMAQQLTEIIEAEKSKGNMSKMKKMLPKETEQNQMLKSE